VKRANKPEFAMLQLDELQKLIELFASRQLQPRDAVVLLGLLTHTDTFSGKIRVSTARLAEELQANESGLRASMSRLKKADVLRLVRSRDTGETYYRINPLLICTSGKSGLFGLAMVEFTDA
jgi:hypothetical protein